MRYGDFMFPKLFARIAEIYKERHGLTEEQLARVAVKNHSHARLNPLAQMRDSLLSAQVACAESESNPRIAPPLKASDCSQITDGGAALVLCSARFLKQRPRRPAIRLLGYGHTTDHLPLEKKDAPHFSIARKAAEQAYAMAGLRPSDIQAAGCTMPQTTITPVAPRASISRPWTGRARPAAIEEAPTTAPARASEPVCWRSTRMVPTPAAPWVICDTNPATAWRRTVAIRSRGMYALDRTARRN